MSEYDVFLSHNTADKAAVEMIARRLREEAKLEPFLDKWHLVPGEPWQEALEKALDTSRTCAIFLGPEGLGTWENEEMRAALDMRVNLPDYRVIPVLLPGATLPERGRLPRFLARHTWVDFRAGLDDAHAFHQLVCGIQGIAPGPEKLSEAAITCPFRGLQVFDEEHATFFFAREALTQHLVEQLRRDRFLAVIGPSGSGKSSLVRAGLVPQIRTGALPDSERWPVVMLKPGPHPLDTLAARLLPHLNSAADSLAARQSLLETLGKDERGLHNAVQVAMASAPDSRRLFLVVDQFEELFTLSYDEEAIATFIDNLLYATTIAGGQTIAVITMRADFFGKCAAYPALAARLAERDVLVGPMSEEEVRRALEGPAEVVGLHYEKGLVDTILADLGHEPGTLPLLQHTLLELWERRRGSWLTIDAYHQIGGVQGALAQRADAIYAGLTPAQQAAARRVLLRLTQPGEGTEDTRRRTTISELLPTESGVSDVEAVVRDLTDARLLITSDEPDGGQMVDVAHEALIRGWPRLRGWIDEDREALRTHRQLTDAAGAWQKHDHDESFLYGGARLAAAEEWAGIHPDDINPLERGFLEASVALREARRIAARRRVQYIIAGLVVALVIFAGLAFVAFQQRQESDRQRDIAQRRAVETLASSALQALNAENTDLAIALALEASQSDSTLPQTQRALAAAAYAPGTRRLLKGHTDAIRGVAFSPDGRIAVSCSQDNSLRLWDVESGQEIRKLLGHTGKVYRVAFSPDGRTVLSGADDFTMRLWDVDGGQEIHRFDYAGRVYDVAFSPDGRTGFGGSEDGLVIQWDVDSGEEIRRFEVDDSVSAIALSPDGRRVLIDSGDEIILFDIETGEELRRFSGHTSGLWRVAFSPDGGTALSASWDNTLILWDVENGEKLHQFLGHSGWVTDVAFSPDGHTALSASADNTLILWDVDRRAEIRRFLGHSDAVTSVAFSPDGRTAISGSADDTLRLWDLENGAVVRHLAGHDQAVTGLALSPDGRTALSASASDKVMILWDITTGREIRRFDANDSKGVTSLVFSPDGQTALSGSDCCPSLWDVETGQEVHRFDINIARSAECVAFSPDGRTVLSGAWAPQNSLRLWDVETGQVIRRFYGHIGGVASVAFSPDGQTALSGSDDRSLILWNIETGEEIFRVFGHTDGVTSVAFSPDGHTALSGSADHTLTLWNIETGEQTRRFFGHTDGVTSVAFSPDGRLALSGSKDKTLILWDVDSGEEIRRLIAHGDQVLRVAFSPDGRTALSSSADGDVILWEMEVQDADQLVAWTQANRYVREPTCAEREYYRVEPFCDDAVTVPDSALDWVGRGEVYAKQGRIAEAFAAYQEAQELDPTLEISAGSWNDLCWFGTLAGHAPEVMDACERAIELALDNGRFYDTRGLARALTGDQVGAIGDFKVYVEWLEGDESREQFRQQREAWIAELEAGRDPFDAETLEALWNE
jgi:WD40 repeat protein